MNFQVEIGFNPAAMAAISELTQAIRLLRPTATVEVSTTGPAASAASTTKPTKTEDAGKADADSEAEAVTVYWLDAKANKVGTVEGDAAFKALKKKNPDAVKVTESKYKAKLAELEKAANAAADDDDDQEPPSVDDVIEAFSAYLPADLDKSERAERAAFVKPLLERFGAKKATELLPEHRKLAINLVQRKMAGEDIDPSSGDFAELCEEAEESLV